MPSAPPLRYMSPAVAQEVFDGAFDRIHRLVIDLYIWVIIASAILSWLIAFNVVNTSNRFVYSSPKCSIG